ncbi:MAG TPA: hypothetical protein VMT12_00410 [Syntrophales bacterium]|nr:hypothetical protein [Syntrophales bacterium]
MEIQLLIVLVIIVIVLIAVFKRQAGKRFGKIRPNGNITEAYTHFKVNPDLNYYTSGSDVHPNAIIGIDKAWTLESDLWKKKNLDSQSMKELVQGMQAKAAERILTLHGFDIFDDHDMKIGDWFSIMGATTTVEVAGEKRVIIQTPPVDTYQS